MNTRRIASFLFLLAATVLVARVLLASPPWYDAYDFGSKGVVAYWPFDGSAQDVTGAGYNGVFNGDATTTASPLGQALMLDGDGDFVKIDGHVPYENEFTFSGWALFNSSATDDIFSCAHIFAKLATQSLGVQSLTLGVIPSQNIPPFVMVNVSDFRDPWFFLHTPTIRKDNTWVHYAATARPGEVKLYINGWLVETRNFTGILDHGSFAGNFIGGHHDIPRQWDHCSHNGQIDDVVVFDRAISPAEVLALATDSDADGVADFWLPPTPNRAPSADAGPDHSVECIGAGGAVVTLNGAASTDPDGDPLTFTWNGPFGQVGGSTADAIVTVNLPLGQHTMTLTVMDDSGEMSTDEVVVTVVDTTPPTVTAALQPIAKADDDASGDDDDSGKADDDSSGDEDHHFQVVAQAADACDSSPTVIADINGHAVEDGQHVVIKLSGGKDRVRIHHGLLEFHTRRAVLTVTATDAAGNFATEQLVLEKTKDDDDDSSDD